MDVFDGLGFPISVDDALIIIKKMNGGGSSEAGSSSDGSQSGAVDNANMINLDQLLDAFQGLHNRKAHTGKADIMTRYQSQVGWGRLAGLRYVVRECF